MTNLEFQPVYKIKQTLSEYILDQFGEEIWESEINDREGMNERIIDVQNGCCLAEATMDLHNREMTSEITEIHIYIDPDDWDAGGACDNSEGVFEINVDGEVFKDSKGVEYHLFACVSVANKTEYYADGEEVSPHKVNRDYFHYMFENQILPQTWEDLKDCECFCGCCNWATRYDDVGIPICDECELIAVQGEEEPCCLNNFDECPYCSGQLNDQNSHDRVRGTVHEVIKACENCGSILGRRKPDQYLEYFKQD